MISNKMECTICLKNIKYTKYVGNKFKCRNCLINMEKMGPYLSNKIIMEGTIDKIGIDYSRFLITESSIYSMLLPYQVNQVEKIYLQEFKDFPKTIIDATANVGGDTVLYRKVFSKSNIIATEIDIDTCKILKRNMDLLNKGMFLGRNKEIPVDVLCVDSLEYLNNLNKRVDLVNFDPPWGGFSYDPKNQLRLNNIPIGTVVGKTLIDIANCVIVKLPAKTDIDIFTEDVKKSGAKIKYKKFNIFKPENMFSRRGNVAYILLICRLDYKYIPKLKSTNRFELLRSE